MTRPPKLLAALVSAGVGVVAVGCSPDSASPENQHHDAGDGDAGDGDAGDGDGGDGDAGADDSGGIEYVPGSGVPDGDPSDAVFDDAVIYDIRLTMPVESWQDIGGDPWAENWHVADFEWADEGVAQVGVRAFGYSSHVAGKPPLKIDFNREVPGQRWRGLETLKLRNAYYDSSFMHDALAPWMLREAGIPASRTGWARVWVNGERVGLFTVMEAIDDRFLKRNFGNDDGPLYSIDGIRGHGLMPLTDALAYFQYNTEVMGDGSDLEDLTRIVADGTDEELAAVLDVDAFFVESIVRTLSGSQDAFSADGNNFYLYNDPGSEPDGDPDPDELHGTWRIIPWDFNFDFASLGLEPALAVDPAMPWATSSFAYDPTTGAPYTDVLMQRQIASGRDVDATIAELVAGPLAFSGLVAKVHQWRTLLAEDAALDPLGGEVAFEHALANDLLYLHMRLSNELGVEVAECAGLEAGGTWARDLSPRGTVGWASVTADGWYWGDGDVHCLNTDQACIGFDVADQHYCTGLYTHAPSDVTIEVPDGATQLRGAVGLQLFAQDCSNGARFSIVQNGVTLWQSSVLSSYSAAEDIGDVAVQPGEVHLVASDEGDWGCDTTSWLDLRAVP
jgi:hypothetical protein